MVSGALLLCGLAVVIVLLCRSAANTTFIMLHVSASAGLPDHIKCLL